MHLYEINDREVLTQRRALVYHHITDDVLSVQCQKSENTRRLKCGCLGSLGLIGEKQASEKPGDCATLLLHLTPEMPRN